MGRGIIKFRVCCFRRSSGLPVTLIIGGDATETSLLQFNADYHGHGDAMRVRNCDKFQSMEDLQPIKSSDLK